jgi:hypothetical protein
MQPSQDIGDVRGALVQRALIARQGRTSPATRGPGDPRILRELLDEAHARLRVLEQAIERLTAAL